MDRVELGRPPCLPSHVSSGVQTLHRARPASGQYTANARLTTPIYTYSVSLIATVLHVWTAARVMTAARATAVIDDVGGGRCRGNEPSIQSCVVTDGNICDRRRTREQSYSSRGDRQAEWEFRVYVWPIRLIFCWFKWRLICHTRVTYSTPFKPRFLWPSRDIRMRPSYLWHFGDKVRRNGSSGHWYKMRREASSLCHR